MKPLEPLLPGETRSEYLDRLAMEEQMAADFAAIEVSSDEAFRPFSRARGLVETHISNYGMVPHPDRIKHAIGVELGLAEIHGIKRSRASREAAIAAAVAAEREACAKVAQNRGWMGMPYPGVDIAEAIRRRGKDSTC